MVKHSFILDMHTSTIDGFWDIVDGTAQVACLLIMVFDALLRKNIYGLIKCIFNINNDLIRVMYNCVEIVNGTMWISWANSL